MASAFEVSIHARWADMDQNGHMRTVTYLEVAEDSRMQYFASHGHSMGSFLTHRIGPVVSRDELQYRAGLCLLDPAIVRLELAGISPDGARFRLRNTFVRADGRTAATVTSTVGRLDLAERRLTAPPDEPRKLVAELPRTPDFAELPDLEPR
ncbi:MAG TPA: acyl-CoA thioesterase [Methylomirabilota bacterium]|nr:acyl-CoA thioesterase [Methylomirabilota bacterium]